MDIACHVTMYCRLSFGIVTLVCPPIGPPRTVVAIKRKKSYKMLIITFYIENAEIAIKLIC